MDNHTNMNGVTVWLWKAIPIEFVVRNGIMNPYSILDSKTPQGKFINASLRPMEGT